MSNDITHVHSILVVGEVTKDPYFGSTQNGKEYARVEVRCVKTTSYGGQEKTNTEKYVIVTWSKTMMDAIITKLTPGAVVAVTGTHQLKVYEKNGKTTISSEISVPSAQWGGSIHILSNTEERMCYSNSVFNASTTISEGMDEIPF